jgi:hypothetical protein
MTASTTVRVVPATYWQAAASWRSTPAAATLPFDRGQEAHCWGRGQRVGHQKVCDALEVFAALGQGVDGGGWTAPLCALHWHRLEAVGGCKAPGCSRAYR